MEDKAGSGITFVLHETSGKFGLWFDMTREEAESDIEWHNSCDGEGRRVVGFVELDWSSYAIDIFKNLYQLERDRYPHHQHIEELLEKIFEAGVAEGKRQAVQENNPSESRT